MCCSCRTCRESSPVPRSQALRGGGGRRAISPWNFGELTEGLLGVLAGRRSHLPERVSFERMCAAVDTILSLQNPGGGFASYELVRGNPLLELLNPAEVFANIMIEYPYVECTTACTSLLALLQFDPRFLLFLIVTVRPSWLAETFHPFSSQLTLTLILHLPTSFRRHGDVGLFEKVSVVPRRRDPAGFEEGDRVDQDGAAGRRELVRQLGHRES